MAPRSTDKVEPRYRMKSLELKRPYIYIVYRCCRWKIDVEKLSRNWAGGVMRMELQGVPFLVEPKLLISTLTMCRIRKARAKSNKKYIHTSDIHCCSSIIGKDI
jgi:hypothetical protein